MGSCGASGLVGISVGTWVGSGSRTMIRLKGEYFKDTYGDILLLYHGDIYWDIFYTVMGYILLGICWR